MLRGAKAASPLMDMIPSDKCPSLQYMDDVDPGGVADMAGINKVGGTDENFWKLFYITS